MEPHNKTIKKNNRAVEYLRIKDYFNICKSASICLKDTKTRSSQYCKNKSMEKINLFYDKTSCQ